MTCIAAEGIRRSTSEDGTTALDFDDPLGVDGAEWEDPETGIKWYYNLANNAWSAETLDAPDIPPIQTA